jgi:AcrR family transcriptional regulator
MTHSDTRRHQAETPSLRDRNRERTRRLVIEAYADLSLEQGFNNFTMQDIADRVGISHRTLYRYFENREAIVEGLNAEITEKVNAPGFDRFMDGADVLRHNYRVFGQYRKPMLVCALMTEAGLAVAPGRSARTAYFRDLVGGGAPNLNELGKRQLLGLIRVIAGTPAWVRMTSEEIGLSDEDAGAASAWALGVLIEAAGKHEGGDFS